MQGKKGTMSKRINMAFTDENYEYIKIMASATGQTMTSFVNQVLEAYNDQHPDYMIQALNLIEKIKKPG